MRRVSTFSFFVLSLSLLIAVFGVGFGNAQNNDAQTSEVDGQGISILPVPGDSTTTTEEDPTTTSDNDRPTITSEPEPTTSSEAPPTTTDEPTTQDKPTTTKNPPPSITSTSTTSDPATTSKNQDPSTSSSKRLTTTVVTVSGTTIQQTVPAPEPTGDEKPTEAPGLNPGDGESGDSDSGLDDNQKKIIIGVVVGVGGAILLGGLAVVAWRIWGRKKNDGYGDEDEDMMSAGTAVGSSGRDKAGSPSNAGSSPFKSTLDQYHNPGPVNAASNF